MIKQWLNLTFAIFKAGSYGFKSFFCLNSKLIFVELLPLSLFMGKTITFIALLLGINYCTYGQSIIRSNVGSGGSSHKVVQKGKTYFISQSVGQASVIGTSSVNGHTIRQGFQQPPHHLITGKPLAENLTVSVYPNPFSQTVKIAFTNEINEKISVVMFDVNGRVILTKSYKPSQLITLQMQNIASGSYIISVSSGVRKMTVPIVKQ